MRAAPVAAEGGRPAVSAASVSCDRDRGGVARDEPLLGAVDPRHRLEGRMTARRLGEALQVRAEARAQRHDGRRDHQHRRPELERALRVERADLVAERGQRLDGGLRGAAAARDDRAAGQRDRRLGSRRQARARGQRRPQMPLGRLELHRGDGVAAELGQDLPALLLRGRLRQRAAEALGGGGRGAAGGGGAGRRPERRDPAPVPGGGGEEQVRGDPLGRRAGVRERLGRRRVARAALARGEILVERGTDDGVDEPQARVLGEDVGPDEVVRRGRGGLLAQPGHVGGEPRVAVVAEHGDRPRQLVRVRAERREPVQHEPAHGRRPDGLHLARGGGRRRDPRRVDGVQQLAQEQRVAARRGVARAAELVRRAGAQALPRQRGRGGLAERPRVQRDGGGARGHLAPQGAGLVDGRASREEHRDREPLDPLREEGEEAQRVPVDPVAVVDEHEERRLVGEVDDQPVEAVQRLEARVAAVLPRRAREQSRRGTGGARERIGRRVERRLEQLAHHAERERLLELGAGRVERRQARLLGRRARRARQHRLADPGRPLDQRQRSRARARLRESVATGRKLALPLEQRCGRSPRHPCDHTHRESRGETLGDPPLSRGGVRRIVPLVDDVAERNKAKVRAFVDAVWNDGRVELIDELVADDYVGHVAWLDAGVLGPGGVRRLVAGRRRALPGLHVQIDDQVAEDDLVVTRWRATAAPAGAPCCTGISIIRLLAGKQVDCHEVCAQVGGHRPGAGGAASARVQ